MSCMATPSFGQNSNVLSGSNGLYYSPGFDAAGANLLPADRTVWGLNAYALKIRVKASAGLVICM